jgi:ABC-type multidrug transport system permease subunit
LGAAKHNKKTNQQNRGFELSVVLALALLLLIIFSLCKYFLSEFFTKRTRGAALLELNIDN